MTGPPTPPPTSAIEIQDAQREASVPPVAATTAPPEVPPAEGASEAQADEPIVVEQPSQPAPPPGPPLNTYQLLFPALAELASQGKFQELIERAERGDLSVNRYPSVIYAIH